MFATGKTQEAALWDRMRLSLKSDLYALPGSKVERNFRPIREGMNDWDLCFSAWWLVAVRQRPGEAGAVWEFITEAGPFKDSAEIYVYDRGHTPGELAIVGNTFLKRNGFDAAAWFKTSQ